ncbi:hypothetical protein ABB02_01944 [Clostridiaceae bacterium JG1575]|nr:hypothetical protein ABB02_01944 [Clostridiaceae bacterium JG1575]
MSHYIHPTPDECERIFSLHDQGKTRTRIAHFIGRHKSTLAHEWKPNTTADAYSPRSAPAMYQQREIACRFKLKLSDLKRSESVKNKIPRTQMIPRIDIRTLPPRGLLIVTSGIPPYIVEWILASSTRMRKGALGGSVVLSLDFAIVGKSVIRRIASNVLVPFLGFHIQQ